MYQKIGKHAKVKMRLLGIVHGDGNMSYNRLLISDQCRKYHTTVLRPMFWKAFKVRPNIFHDRNRNSYYTHTKKVRVYGFFAENLQVPRGAIREKLFVPLFLKRGSRALQREYVGGLFDAEGSVKSRQAEINFSTTCKEIFDFVGVVLDRAKIDYSRYIRHRHVKPEYEIYIYGIDDLETFHRKIGFTHPEKIIMLKRHIGVY